MVLMLLRQCCPLLYITTVVTYAQLASILQCIVCVAQCGYVQGGVLLCTCTCQGGAHAWRSGPQRVAENLLRLHTSQGRLCHITAQDCEPCRNTEHMLRVPLNRCRSQLPEVRLSHSH